MLIAEELMLLLLDPQRGTLVVHRDDTDPDRLAAAALALDLAEQRALVYRGGQLLVAAHFPSGHAALSRAAAALSAAGPGLPPSSALDLIETRAAPVARSLLESLHRRDLLHRVREPKWWPWARMRYPLRSSQAHNEAVAALRAGARGGIRLRGTGLLLLTDCAGRLANFLDASAHARATAMLLALGQRHENAGADETLLTALRTTLIDE